jgi:anti-anti-sigma factor
MLGTLMTSSADPGARLHVKTANSENVAWIVIQGEADTANLEELEAALTGIELDGQKAVHIDVSGLDFIDVPAFRRLISFAIKVRQSGHDVITRGAPPLLQEVAHILNVRDTLGLT